MANQLTGDFDGVMQISVKQLNGLLAMVHQNEWEKGEYTGFEYPTFPHSEDFRVGDLPVHADEELRSFQEWLVAAQSASGDAPLSVERLGQLVDQLPSGLRDRAHAALGRLNTRFIDPLVILGAVQGRAISQISAPMLVLADGTTSEITVMAYVRVRYLPDAFSHLLPENIHGELRVTYAARRHGHSLKVTPPTDESKISFRPLTNLADSNVELVRKEILKLVRGRFRPCDLFQPAMGTAITEFAYNGFKVLGGNPSSQALAMPVAYDASPLTGDVSRIPINFLEGQDFGFAISRAFAESKLAPMLERLRALHQTIVVKIIPDDFPGIISDIIDDVVYTVTSNSVNLEWKDGFVTLHIAARAVTGHSLAALAGASQFHITVTQHIRFAMVNGNVSITATNDDLTVNLGGAPSAAYDKARASIITQRDLAMASARDAVAKIFQGGDGAGGPGIAARLGMALRRFDRWATARFTAVKVTPHGIIVRGEISSYKRKEPIAEITHHDEDRYSAFRSWIPGGRIERFNWSVYEQVQVIGGSLDGIHIFTPWQGRYRHFGAYRNTFLSPVVQRFGPQSVVCMTLHGTQLDPNGNTSVVSGHATIGGHCAPMVNEPTFIAPDWKVISFPNIWPNPPIEGIIREHIFCHVNMAGVNFFKGPRMNHLVLFPDWNAEQPMAFFHEALALMKRRRFALRAVVVAPSDGLNIPLYELNQKLGLNDFTQNEKGNDKRSPVHLNVTENILDGWTDTFGTKLGHGAFLVDSNGKQAWSELNEVNPHDLAYALQEYLVPAPGENPRIPETVLRPGKDMYPFEFKDDTGNLISLGAYPGQEIHLCFWQSWSQPCLKELVRLQELQDKTGGEVLAIGVCCDRDPKAIPQVRENHNLSIILGHDEGQKMSRALKLRCWPTTIRIGTDGKVLNTQFGLPPRGRVVPDQEEEGEG